MIVFKKEPGAEKAGTWLLGRITAETASMTMEAGESFVPNTPVGNISIERTQDTFSITCWDGMVCFNAQTSEDEHGLWVRDHPLTNEESETRRVEFIKQEMECQDKVGEPIGVLDGRKFVCTECVGKGFVKGGQPKVYRCNIGHYSQTCSLCSKVVVEGKTTKMPNLF